ncbi:MAG: 30S ribosomal protein S16 [Anaerolineae bacterium]
MVKIRLRRTGAKKQPHYRVVVTDSRAPRDGKFIEIIGHYNPRTEPPTVEIDAERAVYWLSVGAQPSAAVKRMLDKMGIMGQVLAVRKGEVSVEELAAEFRAQAEEEAAMEKKAREEAAAAEEAAIAEALADEDAFEDEGEILDEEEVEDEEWEEEDEEIEDEDWEEDEEDADEDEDWEDADEDDDD